MPLTWIILWSLKAAIFDWASAIDKKCDPNYATGKPKDDSIFTGHCALLNLLNDHVRFDSKFYILKWLLLFIEL